MQICIKKSFKYRHDNSFLFIIFGVEKMILHLTSHTFLKDFSFGGIVLKSGILKLDTEV